MALTTRRLWATTPASPRRLGAMTTTITKDRLQPAQVGAPPFSRSLREGGVSDSGRVLREGVELPLPGKSLRPFLFLLSALRGQLPRHEETPDHFIGIDILARFADRLFRLVLLAAGPCVPRSLDAVEDNLRILLAALVSVDLGFHPALLARRQLALLRLLRAAINLRPRLGAIFHRNRRQVHVVLGASAMRNHRV